MKTNSIRQAIAAITLGATLAACEKELPVYSSADDALNFVVTIDEATNTAVERHFTFVYSPDDVMVDTVWVQADTQGFISSADRPFALEQVTADVDRADARPGVHYVAFDNADVARHYVVAAGAPTVRFPVVVMRDASLADGDVSLYFQLRENEYFKQGLMPRRTVKLVISDRLSLPANWSDYYFGGYGPVKHRFMIDHTGLKWDEEFIAQLLDGDWGYIQYLMMKLARELKAENANRAREGLRPLAEADGREVSFGWGESF